MIHPKINMAGHSVPEDWWVDTILVPLRIVIFLSILSMYKAYDLRRHGKLCSSIIFVQCVWCILRDKPILALEVIQRTRTNCEQMICNNVYQRDLSLYGSTFDLFAMMFWRRPFHHFTQKRLKRDVHLLFRVLRPSTSPEAGYFSSGIPWQNNQRFENWRLVRFDYVIHSEQEIGRLACESELHKCLLHLPK